jgi:hypothetical protein
MYLLEKSFYVIYNNIICEYLNDMERLNRGVGLDAYA